MAYFHGCYSNYNTVEVAKALVNVYEYFGYELVIPEEITVSPDGTRVAITGEEHDLERNEQLTSIFIVPADGSADPHRLKRTATASTPKWSPDGSKLAVLAKRDTDIGHRSRRPARADFEPEDEEPTTQVWLFDLDRGGDARRITDRPDGVRDFDWSPDGDRLVISARDPTEEQQIELESRRDGGPIVIERLQHKADGVGWLDDVTTYLFVVDLESGDERRLDDASGAGALEPFVGLQPTWGDRGIAFTTNRTEWPDNSMTDDLYLIEPDIDEPEAERLTDGNQVWKPAWSPSGDCLAFVGGDPHNWYRPREVIVADLDRGTVESRTAELDRTVPLLEGASHWIDDDTLVCPVGDEGWTRLVRLPSTGNDGPERILDRVGRDRTIQEVATGGETVAISISSPEDGHDVFALNTADLDADLDADSANSDLDTDSRPPTRLTNLNDSIVENRDLPTAERVEYENGDGDSIEGLLYLPPGSDTTDRPLPLVVQIHGGPMSYDEPEFDPTPAYLAGQGYAILQPNYRGSSSYGREFAECLRGSRGTLETDDVTSGVEHLAEEGLIDPERTFVTGFSYGGITTAHVLTRVDSFAAGAAEHGVYDYVSDFGTNDNPLWYEDEFGLPWENPETYREISAITDVEEIETPLLITAGEEDWRCPPTQAEQLYVSVRKQGVDAKLVVYQGERHTISDPDRAIHRLETIVDWFETYDPGA
ncbi:MAG: prolyl oligopeptidase family serine peptidase [Halodesulfurarchaeum sp.]